MWKIPLVYHRTGDLTENQNKKCTHYKSDIINNFLYRYQEVLSPSHHKTSVKCKKGGQMKKHYINDHMIYMKWIIYELRIRNQVKLWSSHLWTQFLQLRKEAWKIKELNGVWTRDLAIPVRRSNQLSYETTDVGSWSFVCKNCLHNCKDHSFPWFHIRSSYMIHFIYILCHR